MRKTRAGGTEDAPANHIIIILVTPWEYLPRRTG
jgi:hypothetical protein